MSASGTSGGAVIVTGGAGEIGSRIAELLRSRGRRVVAWDRSPAGAVPETGLVCDITDVAQVEEALTETLARAGRVDTLINAAGVGQFDKFLDLPAADFQRIIDINLNGPINCIRAVLPGMLQDGAGSIINITSIWSTHSGPLRSAYIASKWGLLGFTKALMEEYRGSGIRMCAVSPGPVATRLSERMIPPAERHLWMTPDQAAEVVVAVLSISGDQFVGSEIQAYGRARPSGLWHAGPNS